MDHTDHWMKMQPEHLAYLNGWPNLLWSVCVCKWMEVGHMDTAGNINRGNAGIVRRTQAWIRSCPGCSSQLLKMGPWQSLPAPKGEQSGLASGPKWLVNSWEKEPQAWWRPSFLYRDFGACYLKDRGSGHFLAVQEKQQRKTGGFIPYLPLSPGPERHSSGPYVHKLWGQKQQRHIWKQLVLKEERLCSNFKK